MAQSFQISKSATTAAAAATNNKMFSLNGGKRQGRTVPFVSQMKVEIGIEGFMESDLQIRRRPQSHLFLFHSADPRGSHREVYQDFQPDLTWDSCVKGCLEHSVYPQPTLPDS